MGMRGCESATECRSDRPGHGLHAMQERLAATTASKWIDAIVVDVDDGGFATIVEFDGGDSAASGTTTDSRARCTAGEPVALHALYGVLARGDERFSVAYA